MRCISWMSCTCPFSSCERLVHAICPVVLEIRFSRPTNLVFTDLFSSSSKSSSFVLIAVMTEWGGAAQLCWPMQRTAPGRTDVKTVTLLPALKCPFMTARSLPAYMLTRLQVTALPACCCALNWFCRCSNLALSVTAALPTLFSCCRGAALEAL